MTTVKEREHLNVNLEMYMNIVKRSYKLNYLIDVSRRTI